VEIEMADRRVEEPSSPVTPQATLDFGNDVQMSPGTVNDMQMTRRIGHLQTYCEQQYSGDMELMFSDLGAALGIEIGGLKRPSSAVKAPYQELKDEGRDKHVLICGWSASLQYITRLLLPERIHVTILSKSLPSELEKESLRQGLEHSQTHLHFMIGNPTQSTSLKDAEITRKDAVIMLAKEKVRDASGQSNLVDDLIHDTDVILGHNLVRATANGIQPITELTHSSSVAYLDSATGIDENVKYGKGKNKILRSVEQKSINQNRNSLRIQKAGDTFAAGHVYTNMLSTVLIAKTQTMPSIASLIKTFVYGLKRVSAGRHLRITHVLMSIEVPSVCVGKTYGELVSFLLSQPHHDVPIGLYRGVTEARKNRLPYVLTNPGPDLIVEEVDSIYILVNSSLAMSGDRRPRASRMKSSWEAALTSALNDRGTSLPEFGSMMSPGFDHRSTDAKSPRMSMSNLVLPKGQVSNSEADHERRYGDQGGGDLTPTAPPRRGEPERVIERIASKQIPLNKSIEPE